MMHRRVFMRGAGLLAAGPLLPFSAGAGRAAPAFPVVRPAPEQRRFRSPAVEAAITDFQSHVPDAELGWLFGNCFANALDTTVTHTTRDGRPDTFVRLGDLDVMGLRDSSAQLWPYLPLAPHDAALRQLLAGVLHRQAQCILLDPYGSTFYADKTRVNTETPSRPAAPLGVHERHWDLTSLCHPIRLGYHYWKITGDQQPFDAQWRQALALIVETFRAQQCKTGPGPYHFQRPSPDAADTQALAGAGYPARPCGLITSAFGASDAAARLPFLVPGNFFAVASLRQAALMLYDIYREQAGYDELMALADEIALALRQHALVAHPTLGPVYAYEVDGYGGHTFLDEAAVPGLLGLPYISALPLNDPLYQRTRQLALSAANPFFYQGSAAAGLGSVRTGADRIWPLGLAMRGLTTPDDAEIRACVQTLKATQAGTGYLPESFHKDDPGQFARPWCPGANALGAEFLWKVYQERPALLG